MSPLIVGFGFVFSYGLKIEVMVILGAPSPSARSRLRGSIWIRSGATLAPDSERDAGNGEHNHGTTKAEHGGTRGRQTGVCSRTSVTVIAACTIAGTVARTGLYRGSVLALTVTTNDVVS